MRTLTFYDADGATQIMGTDSLSSIVAGEADIPVKVSIRNDGTEAFPTTISIGQVGTSDGVGQLRIGLDTNTLSPPSGLTISVSSPGAGGVWGFTGTYGAVVTALKGTAETTASIEIQAIVSDTTQTVTWSWAAVTGATGYRLYRRPPGATTYSDPALVASVGTTLYIDDGTATIAGAPPADNTTGGAGPTYGTPPTLGTTPITLSPALPAGASVFVWVGRVVPTGTTAQLNTRLAALDFA